MRPWWARRVLSHRTGFTEGRQLFTMTCTQRHVFVFAYDIRICVMCICYGSFSAYVRKSLVWTSIIIDQIPRHKGLYSVALEACWEPRRITTPGNTCIAAMRPKAAAASGSQPMLSPIYAMIITLQALEVTRI